MVISRNIKFASNFVAAIQPLIVFVLQIALSFLGVAILMFVASTIIRWLLIGVYHVTDPNPPHKYKLSYVDMYTGRVYTKTIKALTMQAAQDKAVEFIRDKEWKQKRSFYIEDLRRCNITNGII